MKDQELEIILTERCTTLDLKKVAFESLEQIFVDNSNDENFLCGFQRIEIKTIFDRFKFHVDRRHGSAIIRTRIGLYIEDEEEIWLDNIEPIGYYELETDFDGNILDDWFIIDKEKYLKDIGIISHFQMMNQKLPIEYLKRNHIQYELVTYISLIGTLFISKQFEGAGMFVIKAYNYLESTDNTKLDKDYLKESKKFLKMMKHYLLTTDILTENYKLKLSENKNCG